MNSEEEPVSARPSGSPTASHSPSPAMPSEDDLDAHADMPFSLRKPKDFKAGLSSGMKTIGKGVLAGVVGVPLSGLGNMLCCCVVQDAIYGRYNHDKISSHHIYSSFMDPSLAAAR